MIPPRADSGVIDFIEVRLREKELEEREEVEGEERHQVRADEIAQARRGHRKKSVTARPGAKPIAAKRARSEGCGAIQEQRR